jgi:predicted RecB family nuclease
LRSAESFSIVGFVDRGHLSASSFSLLYRPSRCERRVYLAASGAPGAEPSELSDLIRELGLRHEQEHLAAFPEHRDLSEGNMADRARRTKDAVAGDAAVIYQGVMRAAFPGTRDVVSGIPDFLIRDGDSYRIRDCKLSRSAGEATHPEISRQLQVYGWLFQTAFGKPPAALEAYLGDRSIASIPYAGAEAALRDIGLIRELSQLAEEPYAPVGWSKCSECPYFQRCWTAAEEAHDVSLVHKLDQATALVLRAQGVRTYDELLAVHTPESLAQVRRPQGTRMPRIGAAAGRILSNARALASGKGLVIGPLNLPPARWMVMFDLEGVPPQYEELEKVYLWGMQVYGPGGAGAYLPAAAGFGPDGDREGWDAFLTVCERILAEHGDLPFVHWAPYEKNKLSLYIERFGDRRRIAERVRAGCFDLLTAVREAFALPVPGYGLKVIEKLAGFQRSMEEYGGDWSIAQYLRASASSDESERRAVMEAILRYNQEDLRATWAVLQWARAWSRREADI